MVNYVAIQSGPFSTAATWGTVTNAPAFGTGIVPVTTTNYSGTFTAPNITNACVGVLVYVATTTPAGGYSYTMTLQEATVDTAATVTIADTEFPPTQNWIFFKFPTPYVFTAITADRYRFKLVRSGSGTTDLRLYSNTGTSTTIFLIQAVDNRAAVPGAGQNIYVIGANGSTSCTVTMDGTQSVGVGTDVATPVQKTLGNAVTISKAGLLNFDIVASATITVKGHIVIHSGGELRIGTVAVPYPSDKVANIIFNQNGTSCNYGMMPFGNGTILMQGAPKSSTDLWKTTYVSGVGTAADPMIVATSVAWIVGDEIIVGASSDDVGNFGQSENKFIKTVVSPTTYVISDSKGGAEAALTYTHNANARVINVERNILINATDTFYGWYFYLGVNIYDTRNFDWCRFETLGRNTNLKYGFQIANQLGTKCQVDYCVAYRSLKNGFYLATSKEPMSFTGLISCNSGAGADIDFNLQATNTSFIDCIAINTEAIGFAALGVGNTFTRCIAISCGIVAENEGIRIGGNIGCVFNDCESHCNSGQGLYATSTVTNLVFNNFLCGTKGLNLYDIGITADYYYTMKFVNSSFYSAAYMPGHLDTLSGTEICFDTLNGDANKHFWYTNTGTAQSTGAGLDDTIVRTPGSLAVRLSPENSTSGFTWEFNIFSPSNSIINFFGYFKKNAAFGADVARVELWLPGSSVADDTFTLANDTTWQPCSLSKTYTGSTNILATIKVIGITATAGAYLYCDDFFNAGDTVESYDKVCGLDTWYEGKPVDIISPQQVSPADIWTYSTNDLTTADTTGKYLCDINNIESGRWHRSGTKLYLFKPDNLTSVATFSLKKSDGTDAGESDDVYEQTRD